MARAKLRLGVSACLLGQEVRWDGAHKRDALIVDVLGRSVEWVPVCPEVEVGMGVPREPIRLVGDPAAPRLLGERSGNDHTGAMLRFSETRVRELERLDLAARMPLLPIEEEDRLDDPAVLRSFLEWMRAYRRSKAAAARR